MTKSDNEYTYREPSILEHIFKCHTSCTPVVLFTIYTGHITQQCSNAKHVKLSQQTEAPSSSSSFNV